jgi:hypothetical protein
MKFMPKKFYFDQKFNYNLFFIKFDLHDATADAPSCGDAILSLIPCFSNVKH